MKRPLHFGHLLQVVKKEQQYHDIKYGTEVCMQKGLSFGLSFYGPSYNSVADTTTYKRIEVWCRACPTVKQVKMLHDFFERCVPKVANSLFAFDNGELFQVKR